MNALNTLVRPTGSSARDDREARDEHEVREVRDEATVGAEKAGPGVRRGALARVRDADGMSVASFVMGLAGLLVFNLVLGPCALVLGGLALMRGTTRRGRAALGLTLGAADLIVLAAVSSADQSVSWSITG
jgi:hypothetical protein